jgi:predicted GNAT family N-acyltransferase
MLRALPMSWILYRHSKGKPYLGLGTALHSETGESLVVYRCLYDNDRASTWVRPALMFHGMTDDGRRRFEPIARMRIVQPEENAIVLRFGHDTWGEGEPVEEFVRRYDDNPNHLRGTRYLLESIDSNDSSGGEMLCNLNTLRFRRGLMGIASVATAPQHRKRGWASMLMRAVMELMRSQDDVPVHFLLFSEVEPGFYRTFGFSELPESQQHHLPSIAMSTGANPLEAADERFVQQYF